MLHDDPVVAAHPDTRRAHPRRHADDPRAVPEPPGGRGVRRRTGADLCEQLGPDLVELESALYAAWDPSYVISLELAPLTGTARAFAGQCFCARAYGCRAARPRSGGPAAARAGAAREPPTLASVRARGASTSWSRRGGRARARVRRTPADLRRSAMAAFQGASPEAFEAADAVGVGCGTLTGAALTERFAEPGGARRRPSAAGLAQLVAGPPGRPLRHRRTYGDGGGRRRTSRCTTCRWSRKPRSRIWPRPLVPLPDRPDRLLPDQKVTPEEEPSHSHAGQYRGGLVGDRLPQRSRQGVPDVHVFGRAALRLFDHLRGAIEGVDLITSLGETGRARSGATADIQHPPAGLRHLAKQQPVEIGVVIPIEHDDTLPRLSLATGPGVARPVGSTSRR